MANGLSVISSNIAALDWARAAEGLIFFASGDSQDLFQSLKHVISWSPQKIQSIATSNREFINTNCTVDTWAQNIFNLYKKILREK